MRDGLYRAIVAANNDPKGQDRVRLRVPTVFGPESTGWATPMMGAKAPDVGERVWAAFEAGDESRPVYFSGTAGTGIAVQAEPPENPDIDDLWLDTDDPSVAVTTQHNDLAGLTVGDPHPQYSTATHGHDYVPATGSGNGLLPAWGQAGQNLGRITGGDLNDDRPSGFYEVEGNTATANLPIAGSTNWYYLFQLRHGNSGSYSRQIATRLNPGGEGRFNTIFTRYAHAGAWQPWRPLGETVAPGATITASTLPSGVPDGQSVAVGTGSTNGWPTNYPVVITYKYGAHDLVQLCYGIVEKKVFFRFSNSGLGDAWSDWSHLLGDDSGWIEITDFYNGATAYQTGLAGAWTPRCRRMNGVVYLQGLINTNATTNPLHVATLPVGFRPRHTLMENIFVSGANYRRMDIDGNGSIIFREANPAFSTGWHSITSSFPQEN